MSTKNPQNRPIARHVDRAKIEIRESANGPGYNETESLTSHLRSDLDNLISSDCDSEERFEVARLKSQRDSISSVLRTLLSIEERMSRFEKLVTELHQLAKETTPTKAWYTVKEVSDILGKAEFTVREWCRLGRVNASKRDCGRGNSQEWIVSLDELKRVQNEGLLPD